MAGEPRLNGTVWKIAAERRGCTPPHAWSRVAHDEAADEPRVLEQAQARADRRSERQFSTLNHWQTRAT
jgi:hypothetical protein